jgi:hypothetical protein
VRCRDALEGQAASVRDGHSCPASFWGHHDAAVDAHYAKIA